MDHFPPSSLQEGVADVSFRNLRNAKYQAVQAFCGMQGSNVYSSPRLLRYFLNSQLTELSYPSPHGGSHGESHSMISVRPQLYQNDKTSFLSILCTDCRYHFHIKTYETGSRALDDAEHPSHMLLPIQENPLADSSDHGSEYANVVGNANFVCAAENCFYTVSISVMPPKFSDEQIFMLKDDARIARNLKQAREEDPQRYLDTPDRWATGSTVPTLIQYLQDRLERPTGDVLRIKKRNKKFRVAFGNDFDDLLRSLGFEERNDDDDEECWYITAPEPDSIPTKVHTRRAFLQDALEELRLYSSAATHPAWAGLLAAFAGSLPRSEADLNSGGDISEDDLALLGCLREFSPRWFSWAAILLASLCPSRRDEFLDAGLRCIQQRNEEASLNIVVYKSKFDQEPPVDPQVQAALDFYDEDGKDASRIVEKYRAIVNGDSPDTFKAQAYQHLEAVSNFLGADLMGDVARGDSLAHPAESISGLSRGNGSRRMSVGSASRLLNVESDFTAEIIRDFAVNAGEVVDRRLVIDALEVLSSFKKEQGKPTEADSLHETAEFLRATGDVAEQPNTSSSQPAQAMDRGTRFTTPPGLNNIGNTCYLNSLLQYFYNVKPVREMVLNYGRHEMGLDEASIDSRRTGGNGTPVNLEEAIVARQFIEELRRLFLELQVTTEAAASPSQKLANTALSSAKEILTTQQQAQPPPLPARPSPMPPPLADEPGTTVNVTVEPVEEHNDVASSSSSQTLVHELENIPPENVGQKDASLLDGNTQKSPSEVMGSAEHIEDVAMHEISSVQNLEEKFAHISQRLEQSDRSGTSQQDVEEIIGNIMEHLMRAIRPDGPMVGKPNLQADQVTRLFFTTIVNSTVRTNVEPPTSGGTSQIGEDVLNEEVVPERWITAFPHPDKEHATKSDLYQALDRYFSYELLSDGGLGRYTTIRALPPIVHICIQRTDASGIKNKNPVIIPQELYLDRYMEAATTSQLEKTRRRIWAIKERIKELESRAPDKIGAVVEEALESHNWNNSSDNRGDGGQNQKLFKFDSELLRDIARPKNLSFEMIASGESTDGEPRQFAMTGEDSQDETLATDFLDKLVSAGQAADTADAAELDSLRKEESEAFNDLKQYKYCLHAVICHGGGMNAGHYWVWIRDFKKQVWYKYNDSLVSEDTRDSQHVIDELNNSGDPYYVAYVLDEAKDALVEVPQRVHTEGEDISMTNDSDRTLEAIDSVAIDGLPQPANSPVDPPVHEITMQETFVEEPLSHRPN